MKTINHDHHTNQNCELLALKVKHMRIMTINQDNEIKIMRIKIIKLKSWWSKLWISKLKIESMNIMAINQDCEFEIIHIKAMTYQHQKLTTWKSNHQPRPLNWKKNWNYKFLTLKIKHVKIKKNQSRQWNWDHEHQDHQPRSRDWNLWRSNCELLTSRIKNMSIKTINRDHKIEIMNIKTMKSRSWRSKPWTKTMKSRSRGLSP